MTFVAALRRVDWTRLYEPAPRWRRCTAAALYWGLLALAVDVCVRVAGRGSALISDHAPLAAKYVRAAARPCARFAGGATCD